MPKTADTDVVIVGAGPTGLMLALCLAKQGVRSTIVDSKTGPTRESRALILHARTMEILDQLGLADVVLDEVVIAETVRPGFEKRAFSRINLRRLGRGLTPFPRLYVLEQSATERILGEAVAATGTRIWWQHEFVSIETDAAPGVRVTTRTAAGDLSTFSARYCVGADGSSSPVRKSVDIPFEGTTNAATFYVIDAAGVAGLDLDAINVRLGRRDFLLGFPMASVGSQRLLGTIRGDADDVPTESAVREVLRRTFGVDYEESRWYSTYRVHHRVARTFRAGPVFLAGDAAHVHSPVGAQGMNTGLQDAHNLAAALTDVLHRGAPESRLDRYGAERRPVAQRLVSTTDTMFGFITSERRMPTFVRRAIIRFAAPVFAVVVPRIRASSRLFGYLSQTRIHYRMSSTPSRQRHDIIGRRLPWNGDNYDSLGSLEWQVHTYGTAAADAPARIAETLDLPLRNYPVIRNEMFQPGTLYLVRPDGFVAATSPPANVHDLFELVPRSVQ